MQWLDLHIMLRTFKKTLKRIYYEFIQPFLQKLGPLGKYFTPVNGYYDTIAEWLLIHPDTHHVNWKREIHPSILIDKKQPEIAVPSELVSFDWEDGDTYQQSETFIAHLNWGYVATPACEVLTPDRYLIGEFLFAENRVLDKLTRSNKLPVRPRARQMSGSYATIFNIRSKTTYGHWIRDGLPRLWVLEQSGIPEECRLILPPNPKPFITNMLSLPGYSGERVIQFDGGLWQLEHLYVPSFASSVYWFPRPEAMRWLRERLTSAVPSPDKESPKRILINRTKTNWRRILNRTELLAVLEPFGFVDIIPEELDPVEQIRLFAGAEIVMGVSGSGLDNALCMPSGGTVVELVGSQRRDPDVINLTNALNLRHVYVTKTGLPDELEAAEWWTDWVIPIDRVKEALRQMEIL